MSQLREERGAIAVIVGIMATLLFGLGAVAVDLANGWSRKRESQNAADFAAFAGAAKLDNTATGVAQARNCAYTYLLVNLPNSDPNATPQPGENATKQSLDGKCVAAPPQSPWSDGNFLNGEICFPIDENDINDPSDDASCLQSQHNAVGPSLTRIRVILPQRYVEFGLANSLPDQSGAGISPVRGVDVTATATVELRSRKGIIAPFGLPAACNSGQQGIFDTPPGQGPGGSQGTLQWHQSNGQAPTITGVALDPSTPPQTGRSVTIPANTSAKIDVYGTRFDSQSQLALVTNATPNDLSPIQPITATEMVVNLPASAAGTTYYLQAFGNNKWSTDNPPFFSVTVGAAVVPPGSCPQNQGNFGKLDSPRHNSNANDFDLNMALGGDHGFKLFTSPGAPGTPCAANAGSPIAGAVTDSVPNIDTNLINCLHVLPGRASDVTQGLIKGTTGNGAVPGRLASTTSSDCHPPGGSNPTEVLSTSINNDVLSCFLVPGATLAQLNGQVNGPPPTNDILRSEIMNSPRFVFVPVYNASGTEGPGWYELTGFVGGFITYEPPTTLASPDDNGIQTSNSQVTQLLAYIFPLGAIRDNGANNGESVPYIGVGPGVTVLVN
jgi:hypothetical protein